MNIRRTHLPLPYSHANPFRIHRCACQLCNPTRMNTYKTPRTPLKTQGFNPCTCNTYAHQGRNSFGFNRCENHRGGGTPVENSASQRPNDIAISRSLFFTINCRLSTVDSRGYKPSPLESYRCPNRYKLAPLESHSYEKTGGGGTPLWKTSATASSQLKTDD